MGLLRKTRVRIHAVAVLTACAVLYQDCGSAKHSEHRLETADVNSACDQQLLDVFSKQYHPMLRRIGCHQCHAPGGQKSDSPFAQELPSLAYLDFKTRGPNKINNRIQDGHKASEIQYSNTDQHLLTEIETYLTSWQTIENTCGLNSQSLKTSDKSVPLYRPETLDDITKCGLGDPLKENHEQFSSLEWNLGELRLDLDGVKVSVVIKPNLPMSIGGNLCGHQGYRAGGLMVTTTKALTIRNVRLLLNGNNYDSNMYLVERSVPAGAVNFKIIDTASGGFSVYESGSCRLSDQWSIYFEFIAPLPLSQ